MAAPNLILRSPDGEDVVLLRALGHGPDARFAVLHPTSAPEPSWVTTLRDAGWQGNVTAVDDDSVLEAVRSALAEPLRLLVVTADLPVTEELTDAVSAAEIVFLGTQDRSGSDFLEQVVHWRALALSSWGEAVAAARYDEDGALYRDDAARARTELAALQRTISWRVTRPLRGGRRALSRLRRS
ncbi:hypothetical protein [Cellulomonas sp. URHE0023]|uniref:hypothetical protein n=1 Tax=Cellulomonas sp. URHE0023 TaxID=1380354 RepID=UPI00047F36EB|nr:hypothetical protein [Cellulomonas sp. URHE0023]